MKNAVILHGTYGNSKENWLPWLKKELVKRSYKVFLPDLPGANHPDVCTYNVFLDDSWDFNKDTIMIGHSSGAVAILGLLNKIPESKRIKKAILVAGFKDQFLTNFDSEVLKDLFIYDFDWEKLKRMAGDYIIVNSDNDPYVPLSHGEFLAEKLGGKLIVKKGMEHFSGEECKELPFLLKLF